jgi:methyl-accepting chemotaxis protein
MAKTKVRFGLFQKILMAMLLVSLVPMGLIWYLNFRAASEQSTRLVEERLSSYADNLRHQVDAWVEMNRRMLMQNASIADMRSMGGNRQEPLLRSIVDKYEWNYLAFTTDLSGNNIARSDGKALKYYGDRQYFLEVVNGAELGKQVLIGKTSGQPALVLATPIFDENRKLAGVLSTAMTIGDISNTVAAARIGRTGFAFLLDDKGLVVAHPSEEFTRVRKDLSTHAAFAGLNRDQKRSITFKDENGKEVLAFMTKTAQGWTMVAQQETGEAFQSLAESNRNALMLLGVTLILVVAVSLKIALGLARPILNLTRIAEMLSKGQLDVTIKEVSRTDEIGALAQAVERLGASIRYAMERLKKAKSISGNYPS